MAISENIYQVMSFQKQYFRKYNDMFGTSFEYLFKPNITTVTVIFKGLNNIDNSPIEKNFMLL